MSWEGILFNLGMYDICILTQEEDSMTAFGVKGLIPLVGRLLTDMHMLSDGYLSFFPS